MTDRVLLFHSLSPSWLGGALVTVIKERGLPARQISLAELSAISVPVVCYRRGAVAHALLSENLELPKLISIEMAARLLCGKPRSAFDHGQRPWEVVSRVSKLTGGGSHSSAVASAMLGLGGGSVRSISKLAVLALEVIEQIWDEIDSGLEMQRESSRFWGVEVPVDSVLLYAEHLGIKFDCERRDTHYNAIEREYYGLHHKVAIGRGIEVDRALCDLEYLFDCIEAEESLRSWAGGLPPRDVIRYLSDWDELCGLLHRLAKLKRDRRVLDQLGMVREGLVEPDFECVGTVTSRILMKEPSLQNLSKRFRDVVVARDGFSLVYVDYDAFEPHILAWMSRDEALLSMCRSGDPYAVLAETIGGNHLRKAAKTLFLSYSYGMGEVGLGAWASKLLGITANEGAQVAKSVVSLFPSVEKWKGSVFRTLEEKGRVGTRNGNFRYRLTGGELLPKERRWAISQVVQGTGSLILKHAILKASSLERTQLLLPMHDAALFEVPSSSSGAGERLIAAFRAASAEVLEGMEIPASVERFSEGAI